MIDLGLDTLEWPRFRVRYAEVWMGAQTPWKILPMQAWTGVGFTVRRFSRRCLPDEGEAVLSFDYGTIDGRKYLNTSLPDLVRKEIRIEFDISRTKTPVYVTVWWGECVAKNDGCWPGSTTPNGTMEYHCKDCLHRWTRFPMMAHQYYSYPTVNSGDRNYGVYGHPGFNVTRNGRVIGNQYPNDPNNVGYNCHGWPGAAGNTPWTDAAAIDQAIASSTPRIMFEQGGAQVASYVQPLFSFAGVRQNFQGVNVWQVAPRQDLRSFIATVCDRRRGRGVVYGDWNESGDVLTPILRARSQFREDVSEILPSGVQLNLVGATGAGTLQHLDLIGDHRLGEDAESRFRFTDEGETFYNRLEVAGDPLRVLISVSPADLNFTARYSATEASTYDDASEAERSANPARWAHVYRTFGLPLNWDFTCGKGLGDGSGNRRCDYRINDNGTIRAPADPATTAPPSMLLTAIADELPLQMGYDYSAAAAVRWDGASETHAPQMLPVQVWIRASDTGDYWVDADSLGEIHVSRAGNEDRTDLDIKNGEDAGRFFEVNDPDDIQLTIAIDLPYPLQMAANAPGDTPIEGIRKTKTIDAQGLALHLAHPFAIWSLNEGVTSEGGFQPRRAAGAGVISGPSGHQPGILRDDRDALATVLYLGREWYLRRRRPVAFTLACCGFAGTWLDSDGEAQPYLAFGNFLGELSYSGRTATSDTPVTGMDYNHDTAETTWITSWGDFDWRAGRR